MTTRRIDKTRKPPRRPAARPAARPVDSTKTGEIPAGETAPESVIDEPEAVAASDAIESAGSATSPETEAVPEEAHAGVPVASADEPVVEEPSVKEPSMEEPAAKEPLMEEPVMQAPSAQAAGTVPDAQEHQASETEPALPEAAVQEPVAQDPVAHAAAGEPVAPTDGASVTEPVADASASDVAVPAAADLDDRTPAPAPQPEAASETPEQPASDGEEIPLAAMQGLIEINGRLVAFMQGEGQAAVAFWKAALAARTPGDLAQIQAAEVSRAFDAALACWTDLARRMGRFPAFVPPRARAA
ncbi:MULTISPECIES: hypothetical protein [Methylobacterium]|uniref:hypothetical protein n=1 Tax=Methylobacterium TaxID=407 RepID=UPI0013E9B2B1|nr:hypothetical protein [Methylobacterium sp. DB0501]NGM36855.1 hypothetical protein [Methylobacterium sp. DB0501]